MIMKKFLVSSMFLFLGLMTVSAISPYLRVADLSGSLDEVVSRVNSVLEEGGYDVIGQYQPGSNPDLYVMVFSSNKLQELCIRSADRGMLAAALKVGFQRTGDKVSVSMVNPEYLFYAYFRDLMENIDFKTKALQAASEVKTVMLKVGKDMEAFGGDLSPEKLMKYRYMAGMPKFDKPVSLAEFDSFQEGISAIQQGLSSKTNTHKVYEIFHSSEQIAVFGVGLPDKEEGEAHFLPIIGESHVAAMPYEIILQGGKVSMLHGRFRFALHWPELTMKTFTKIMSSPGDVEDAMKDLF